MLLKILLKLAALFTLTLASAGIALDVDVTVGEAMTAAGITLTSMAFYVGVSIDD